MSLTEPTPIDNRGWNSGEDNFGIGCIIVSIMVLGLILLLFL